MLWKKREMMYIYVCVCALVVQGSLNPAFYFYNPCKGDLFASHPLKSESFMSWAPQWAWVSDALLLGGRGRHKPSELASHLHSAPCFTCLSLSLPFPLGRFKIRIRMDIQPDSYCTPGRHHSGSQLVWLHIGYLVQQY